MFGFHGIWQGAAVLYDRGTNSHWQHLTGESINGPLKGVTLKPVSGRHMTWKEWRRDYPESTVMAESAEFRHLYYDKDSARRGNPYFPPVFPPTIETRDERLPLTALCFGVWGSDVARAYPFESLKLAPGGVVNDKVGETPVVVFIDAKTESAAGYSRRLDGEELEFKRSKDGLLEDTKSGAIFGLDGRCRSGPFQGKRLPSLNSVQAEWYGWFATHPKTSLYDPSN